MERRGSFFGHGNLDGCAVTGAVSNVSSFFNERQCDFCFAMRSQSLRDIPVTYTYN